MAREVAVQHAGTRAVPGRFSATELRLDLGLSFEEWRTAALTVFAMHESATWALGDAWLYGEQMFGEEYAQAIPDRQYAKQTIANAMWLCRRFPPSWLNGHGSSRRR